MKRYLAFLVWMILCSPGFPAQALTLETPLPDPVQETRARSLFYAIRCVVCQGESIADSGAEVASDMRALIRRRISERATDEEITQYLTGQYGQSILMTPPLRTATYALWFGPVLLLILGGLAAYSVYRPAKPFSDIEGSKTL